MEFYERLKELRQNKSLTQQEVADKLYISRSLYAKYESGISIPDKKILQKISILFNVGVKDIFSRDETTFIVVEENSKREKIKKFVTVSSCVASTIFSIFYFLPIFQVYSYIYPAPEGQQPERVLSIMSSFTLLNSKGVWLGNLALLIFVSNAVLSILGLIIFNRYKAIIRLVSHILFVLSSLLFFVIIVLSCGFSL